MIKRKVLNSKKLDVISSLYPHLCDYVFDYEKTISELKKMP